MDHSILRFAKRFFAGTLLSRISGAVRDIAMAFCFGSAPEIAAFMVAYRLANLFRRLFGEGNMQAGFVPHFEALPRREAFLFYRDTAFTMLVLLLAAVLGIEMIFGMGVRYLSAEWAEIASLAMWMAPGLIFICLYALNGALLQTQRSFFSPAVAPVFFNAAWIAAAFFSRSYPIAEAVWWLSIGIVVAFALQWMMTAFQVRRCLAAHLSWREWFQPRLFSSEWKKLVRPLTLGVVGVGAMQINSALDAIFARFADPSGPAFLWYALRVQQLPLALFGIALSGALLPPLARAMQEGAIELYRKLLQDGLRHAMALMIPCTFALFALGPSGLNLLFGRGSFAASDLIETLYCLWGYGFGLAASVLVLLLASGFYAKKLYRVPTLASLFAVGFNALLNALFIFGFHWGAKSVAFATSLASFANASILIFFLQKKVGKIFPPLFWGDLSRLLFSGMCAFGITVAVGHFLGHGEARRFDAQLIEFAIGAGTYLTSFLGAARLLGLWETLAVFFKTPALKDRD